MLLNKGPLWCKPCALWSYYELELTNQCNSSNILKSFLPYSTSVTRNKNDNLKNCNDCFKECCLILQNMTGGSKGGLHITDITNASRTMFLNLKTTSLGSLLVQVSLVSCDCWKFLQAIIIQHYLSEALHYYFCLQILQHTYVRFTHS